MLPLFSHAPSLECKWPALPGEGTAASSLRRTTVWARVCCCSCFLPWRGQEGEGVPCENPLGKAFSGWA